MDQKSGDTSNFTTSFFLISQKQKLKFSLKILVFWRFYYLFLKRIEMLKSRLYELFSAFAKTEQRELGKFVKSPVFNQREDVQRLYQYMYHHFPKSDKCLMDRETVFEAIFPKEKFDAVKMDYTMSFLFQVMKSYLIFKELSSDPVSNQIVLARSLRKRSLGRLFEKEYKTAKKQLISQPYRNTDFHFHYHELLVEQMLYSSKISRNLTSTLGEASKHLTSYYLAKKLWEACTAVMHKTVWEADMQESDILEAILNHVESTDYSKVPAVNLYYVCYKALTEKENLHWFERLRQLIKTYYASLPQGEVRDLYLVAINYCIRRFNTGEEAFIREAFQLYREGLDISVFLENGFLSRFTYNNIVVAGLRLKEFNWVEKFLHDYKETIELKYRESTFKYNLAIYYFQKPDHERALELLRQAEFDDVIHNLIARKMVLQIFLEKDEREVLSSWLISFKNFIYRHKELGNYQKDRYLNLIKFTKRILSVDRYDKVALKGLKQEIEGTEQVAEKEWLLGIINFY